ncbi:hypothetical protein HaLaN_06358 [Haematococcus lacustris]|uniref:Uncharacterized protein n=1 Tax=Haematococcus lacustris TaxID=44745 RepID=A0A699Z663_HAELA|nr:hypothetical protein HaLaN_06358 [Haematococcus lacustris]
MARAERAARQAQAAAAGAAAVVAYTQAASALKRLFNELEPDVEFGCCAAFLGPAFAPTSSGHAGGTAADAGLVQQSMEGNALSSSAGRSFLRHIAGSTVLGQNGSAAAEVAQPPSGSVETPQSGQWAAPAPGPGAECHT